MAFDAFNDEGGFGGNGGGNSRFVLRFCKAVDYRAFYGQDWDDPDAPRKHWMELYPTIHLEQVDSFDPRNHPLPGSCATVMIFDTLQQHGYPAAIYTYGHIITWDAAANILGRIGRQAGLMPPFPLPPRGNYVLSSEEDLTPIVTKTTAVFGMASKARPVHWQNPHAGPIHPRLRLS